MKIATSMSATILSTQAIGLVAFAVHDQLGAILAASCARLYGLDTAARAAGLNLRDLSRSLYHDILHPIAYDDEVVDLSSPATAFRTQLARLSPSGSWSTSGGVAFIRKA